MKWTDMEMNESMNEWMNEMNEWMNEWMGGWMKWMNEWIIKRMNE